MDSSASKAELHSAHATDEQPRVDEARNQKRQPRKHGGWHDQRDGVLHRSSITDQGSCGENLANDGGTARLASDAELPPAI
jgi:hypothetical protein